MTEQEHINLAKRSIAVDFDNTMTTGYTKETHYKPVLKPWIKKAFIRLYNAGIRVVVHTCRVNPYWENDYLKEAKFVEDFLKENDVPFASVWQDMGKPYCAEYYDDHGKPLTKNIIDCIINIAILTQKIHGEIDLFNNICPF